MEKIDRDLQQRVWQRVRSGTNQMPPLGRDNLKSWLLTAQENAAAYQSLAQSMEGKRSERLRKLHQELQRSIACAQGICRLRGESVKPVKPAPQKGPAQRILETCCHRERRLWEEAERRSADPEFGLAYTRLARQAADRYMVLLELLG